MKSFQNLQTAGGTSSKSPTCARSAQAFSRTDCAASSCSSCALWFALRSLIAQFRQSEISNQKSKMCAFTLVHANSRYFLWGGQPMRTFNLQLSTFNPCVRRSKTHENTPKNHTQHTANTREHTKTHAIFLSPA